MLRARQRQRDPVADAADPRVEADYLFGRTRDVRQAQVGKPAKQRHRHRVRVHVDDRITLG
jgi:hypothetical protein